MKKGMFLLFVVLIALLAGALPARAQAGLPFGQIAIIGQDGNLYLAAPDGSGQTALTADARNQAGAENTTEGRRYYASPAWSPDGTRLLFYRYDELYSNSENRLLVEQILLLYDAGAGSATEIAADVPYFIWKPDSSGIYYPEPYDYTQGAMDIDRGIWQLDLPAGQPERILAPQNNRPLVAPGISPDGRYLTFEEAFAMEGRGYFAIHDLQQGTTRVWERIEDVVGAYQWTPDGAMLVFDRNGFTPHPGLRIWKADPGFNQMTAISPEVPDLWFYYPSVAPTGDKVAALAGKENDNTTYVWVMNLDGSDARELLKVDIGPYTLSWSPNGEQIALTSGNFREERVQVIDVQSGAVTPIAEGREVAWNPVPAQPAAEATPALAANTATPAGVSQAQPTLAFPTLAATEPSSTPGLLPTIGRMEIVVIGALCLGGLGLLGLVLFFILRRRGTS